MTFIFIVVDDGSTDETEAVARSFGAQVRYLRTPHLGARAARNDGVRAASCDLVAFLDSDDEWLPRKMALQRAVSEQSLTSSTTTATTITARPRASGLVAD